MKLARALLFVGVTSLGARAEARASDTPAQSVAIEGEPATTFLARMSAGVGGSSVGVAGRLGLQLEYWLSEHIGVGAVAAHAGLTSLSLFGGGTSASYWMAGPAFAVRSHSSGTHALASAGFGYMRGSHTQHAQRGSFFCFDGDCHDEDEPARRTQLRGIASTFSVGFAAGDGPVQFGLLGVLDLGHSMTGGELADTSMALTLNLTLAVGIH